MPNDPNDAFEGIDNPLDPDNSLDPKDSEELKSWVETFRQEWQLGDDESKSTSTKLRDQLKEMAEDAMVSLRYTIKHSPNENLKLKATLWLLDSLLSDKGALRIDDPLVAFLEEMRAAKSPKATNQTPSPE